MASLSPEPRWENFPANPRHISLDGASGLCLTDVLSACRKMTLTGLSVFAAVLLWRYGLIRLMVVSDRTYISTLIGILYIVTCGHCFWRTRAIAREAEAARRCRAILSGPDGANALGPDARALPGGMVSDHIKSLVTKAETQRAGRIDQTLLLRSLADRLRGSNGFGAFVSDTLMKLGLLGTIVGFIIMLAPI